MLGKAEAKKRGAFEALYTTVDGNVLEGTTSNVFARFGSTLVTTPIADGVLPGVTRALVLRLAARLADVEQRTIARSELARADELFLTASSIEVLPVVRIGRRRVGDGRPGELTRALQPRYRRAVARSLGVGVEELGA